MDVRVTEQNIEEVIESIIAKPVLSLDTETTGLSETDTPFAVIISDEERNYYFDERNLNFWHDTRFVTLMRWRSEEFERVWVFQNAKFDMRMLTSKGVDVVGIISDDNVAARIQYNAHMQYNLAAQAKRAGMEKLDDKIKDYIAEHGLYEIRRDFFGVETKQPRYDLVPEPLMFEYACRDARLTYDLHHIHTAKFDDHDWRVFNNERKLTRVCYQMERLGVRLDKEYTLKAMYHELDLMEQLNAKYLELTGQEFVNSAKSVQKVLPFQLPVTDSGNPSLTDDVIETLMQDMVGVHDVAIPVLKLVQGIRHYDKRISTYYKPYLNMMDSRGLIHPTMWQAGTKTGRFSYSDPNLQNIPKEEDSVEPYVVRGCFVPTPGNVFVSLDYSQMEYYLMIAYANEVDIIKSIMNGADFHQATADLFGIKRKEAKTLNFAILYGAGNEKLAGMLGVSVSEAARLKTKYFMALPKVEAFVDKVIRTGRSRGYVRNWIGRRLYADYNHCYALPNHLIQGGGADVVKVAMVQIAEQLPDAKMVLQIHDQLVFDLAPEQCWMIPRIKDIMESVFPDMNGVRLKVDVSWSDKSLAERDMKKGIPYELGHASL